MRPVSGTGEDLELRRQRLFERLRAEVERSPSEQADRPNGAGPEPERHENALHEPDLVEEPALPVAETVEPEFGADVAEPAAPAETDEIQTPEAVPEWRQNPDVGGDQPPDIGEPFAEAPPHALEEAEDEPLQAREHDQPAPDLGEAATSAEIPEAEVSPGEDLVPEAAGEEIGEPAEAAKPARPALPRILAVANQKGGVGKTTTTVNLGAALAEIGYRVLVIDLDPQGNATTGLGINGRNLEVSIYDVLLHETPMEDCVEPTSLKNLFVVPATIDLAGAEIELVPAFSRELRLRKSLNEIIDDFDFVLIDCPPSLGLLTVNGLAAATEVLVPIQCEYYALEGLGQLLRNVDLVHQNLNPQLHLSTIVMTMFDARTKLADQVVNDVRSHFGDKVCRNIIPRTVRLSEAPSFGQPITLFDPTSRGAIAYRELAKEVSGGAPQRTG